MEPSHIKPAQLRRIKSLALMSDAQLASFLAHVEVVECAQSQTIFKEGTAGDSMFLILQGQVRVYSKQTSGEMLYLRSLEAGDAFGEVAMLNQSPRSASIEASQGTLLLRISTASMEGLMTREPAVAAQFLYQLARSLGLQLSNLTTRLRAGRELKDVIAFIQ